jgi:hypothetical protein
MVLKRIAARKWLTAFVILMSASPALCQQLSPVTGQRLPQVFLSGSNLPVWSGAWLIQWKFDTMSNEPGENIAFYGRDGRLAGKIRISFPEAFRVRIKDIAASTKGQMAAVGTAYENSGKIAAFLVLLSGDGTIMSVVRTSPFEGEHVGFGSDDSIWVLGIQSSPDRRLATLPEHATVQQFGATGKLLNEYLPYSAWGCAPARHPALHSATLLTSGDRVGILTRDCGQFVEMDLQGRVVARLPVRMPTSSDAKPLQLFGAAMGGDGAVYAAFKGPSNSGLYRLMRGTGAWQAVGGSMVGGPQRLDYLMGLDGDLLVYRRDRDEVVWSVVTE